MVTVSPLPAGTFSHRKKLSTSGEGRRVSWTGSRTGTPGWFLRQGNHGGADSLEDHGSAGSSAEQTMSMVSIAVASETEAVARRQEMVVTTATQEQEERFLPLVLEAVKLHHLTVLLLQPKAIVC